MYAKIINKVFKSTIHNYSQQFSNLRIPQFDNPQSFIHSHSHSIIHNKFIFMKSRTQTTLKTQVFIHFENKRSSNFFHFTLSLKLCHLNSVTYTHPNNIKHTTPTQHCAIRILHQRRHKFDLYILPLLYMKEL